ncbi:antithrombin-III-like [Rhipicephalus microplus]|uniref:antithrombin-III-like n=1 Tax=Rhipicephalus microplus TaxID=6941 RepID=UPI003F6D23D4
MLLLLPNDRRGLHAVEYRLDTEAPQKAMKSCEEMLVELSMPNIELESSVSLRDGLKRAGLSDLFDPEKVDFSGLFEEAREPLTKFVHKAKLRVDKVGYEGEYHGVTVFTENCEYPSAPIEFHVNHPFLCVLYKPVNNTTLFIGRVVDLIW